jgi:hypothetical protein
MFEVSGTKKAVEIINKKVREESLKKDDMIRLVAGAEALKNKLSKIGSSDIYPLKNFCAGLLESLGKKEGWKNNEHLRDASTKINQIIKISEDVVKDPSKAIKTYGGIGDIKRNIEDLLTKLIATLSGVTASVR